MTFFCIPCFYLQFVELHGHLFLTLFQVKDLRGHLLFLSVGR